MQFINLNGPNGNYPQTSPPVIPDPDIGPYSAAAFWFDLQFLSGLGHGIWWSYANGNIYVEYICTSYADNSKYFHFQIEFPVATPNLVKYLYYQMNTNVANAIGVQKDSTSKY